VECRHATSWRGDRHYDLDEPVSSKPQLREQASVVLAMAVIGAVGDVGGAAKANVAG
jgi:hypothetical protein